MAFRDIDPHDIPGYAPKPKMSRRKKLWEATKVGLITVGFILALMIVVILVGFAPPTILWILIGYSELVAVVSTVSWIILVGGIYAGIERYRELK